MGTALFCALFFEVSEEGEEEGEEEDEIIDELSSIKVEDVSEGLCVESSLEELFEGVLSSSLLLLC